MIPLLQLPPPVHSGTEVHQITERVLARREYRLPKPSVLAQLRNRVFDELGRLVARVLDGAHGSLIGWLVVAALVGGIVFLTVRFARSVGRDPGMAVAVTNLRRRTAAEWRAEAEDHERAGNWRPALRCRYRALVADLAGRGLVDDVPGRTAGEYRAEVRDAAPAAAAAFGGATELFELAWYGNRAVGEDDAARFRRLADDVVAGVS